MLANRNDNSFYFIAGKHKDETVKASVTVAELSSTTPINSMILNGQLQTNVNGLSIQNGLATQINAKVSLIQRELINIMQD